MSGIRAGVLRAATAGAWLFAVGSLVPLILLIALGGPGEDSTIASTTIDGTTHNAIGLTYAGPIGAAWLWFQVLVVPAAIALSVLRRNRLRRTGHVILVAWSALWLGNAVWLPAVDDAWIIMAGVGTLFGGLFVCTIIRAIRGWSATVAR